MLSSGFAFHSWQTPRVYGNCIARAKGLRRSNVAELIDSQGDGERSENSLDYAATVALPPAWRAARFGARRKMS